MCIVSVQIVTWNCLPLCFFGFKYEVFRLMGSAVLL